MGNEIKNDIPENVIKGLEKQVKNQAYILRKIKDWLEEKLGADIDGDGRIGSGPYNKVKKALIAFLILGTAAICSARPAGATNIAIWKGTESSPTTYIDQTGNIHAPNFMGDMSIDDATVNNATVLTNLAVNGKVGVGGTMSVTGVATLVSTPLLKDGLNVRTNAIIGGTLTVTGAITGPISAANLTAGTVASAIDISAGTNLSAGSLVAGSVASAISGLAITNLNAANLKAGTVASAIDGSGITNLNASSLASGTVANDRLDTNSKKLGLNDGGSLTNLSAANLVAGTVASAISGLAITNVDAANFKVGTVASAIDGSGITNLSGANVQAASIPGSALAPTIVTNVLTAGVVLPAVDISAVTNGNATTAFSSGTVPDARLSSALQAYGLNNLGSGTNLPYTAIRAGSGPTTNQMFINGANTTSTMYLVNGYCTGITNGVAP